MRKNSAIITGIVLSTVAISVIGTFGLKSQPKRFSGKQTNLLLATSIGAKVSAVAGVNTAIPSIAQVKSTNGRNSISLANVSTVIDHKIRTRTVKVTITNASISSQHINPMTEIYAKSADNTIYGPYVTDSDFSINVIQAGSMATGTVVFRIPDDGQIYTVYFVPDKSVEPIGVTL